MSVMQPSALVAPVSVVVEEMRRYSAQSRLIESSVVARWADELVDWMVKAGQVREPRQYRHVEAGFRDGKWFVE